MKNRLLILLFFCLSWSIHHTAYSQNSLAKQWDYRYGGTYDEVITCFQQTSDEGYIIGGYSYSGMSGDKSQQNWGAVGGTPDYWIVKTDSLGIKQWDKRFGGIYTDCLYALQQTADGGYILGGYSNSYIGGDKTQPEWAASFDYWIVKIDSAGIKQWDYRFGGNTDDRLYSIGQTADGGYILGGYSDSPISGEKTQNSWGASKDYWIVKNDSLGIKQWDKRFGGTGDDELFSLQQTIDGGYILGGYSSSGISGDKTQASRGNFDYWIIKTDASGIQQWDNRFGGTSYDYFHSLQQTTDGGYILGGYSNSPPGGDKTQPLVGAFGGPDFWMVKTDCNGTLIWEKDIGGIVTEDEFGNISQTSDGGYLLSGSSYSDISGDKSEDNLGLEQTWVVKTDASGSTQWDKTLFTLGHDEIGFAIQTKDGCYAFADYTQSNAGGYKTQSSWNNSYDYWLIKFCDTMPVVALPIELVSFTGKKNNNNENILQWTTASEINNDYFKLLKSSDGKNFEAIAKINGAGNSTQVLNYSFTDEHPTAKINYYILQQTDYNGQSTFSKTISLNNSSGKINPVIISPNPASGEINISGIDFNAGDEIQIVNTLGKIIYQSQLIRSSANLRLSTLNFSQGVYFISVSNKNNFYSQKFLKQ